MSVQPYFCSNRIFPDAPFGQVTQIIISLRTLRFCFNENNVTVLVVEPLTFSISIKCHQCCYQKICKTGIHSGPHTLYTDNTRIYNVLRVYAFGVINRASVYFRNYTVLYCCCCCCNCIRPTPLNSYLIYRYYY